MKRLKVIFCVVIIVAIGSCVKLENPAVRGSTPVLPTQPYNYDTPINPAFFAPYGDSIISNDVATLGRVLFYDVQLSLNNRVSCGSCHVQIHGFSDDTKGSVGFMGGITSRNTQTIVNTGTQLGFFWDLREETLDHMVLQPIANHLEMGLDDTLLMESRIRETDYYTPLFTNAFGSDEVTTKKIGLALAQFVKSIISVSTRYDQGRMALAQQSPPIVGGTANMTDFDNYTELENYGKFLFFRKFPCSTCHAGPNLDGSLSFPHNIGLDMHYPDAGMPGTHPLTGEPLNGFFKTPSLRNIALTAPYMHDGRFKTLEEVIDFYDHGVQSHPQLSEGLRIPTSGGLQPVQIGPWINSGYYPPGVIIAQPMYMSEVEKQALIAFLNTMTDYNVISDPKFSDPFRIN